ncbi:MAG: hypothetical protein IT380_08475 [Myxococcales bacterium]|nr:hypothetical protein [Myxococcales bacterium]
MVFRVVVLWLLVALTGCARTGLVDFPPDTGGGAGGGGQGGGTGGGGGGPACLSFAGLQGTQRILPGTARAARFTKDALLIATEPGGEAFRVELPGLSARRLATDVDDVQPLGESGRVLLQKGTSFGYHLRVLDDAGERPLADEVCGHLASPAGDVLFTVTRCDLDWNGTLERIDVASGLRTTIATQASGFSMVVQGERLAVVTGAGVDARCFWGSARCELRTLAGGLVVTSGLGCHHPTITRAGEVLALRQPAGCADVTVQDLLIRRAAGGPFDVLARSISPGPHQRWELDLSPDQRTLLAQRRGATGVDQLAIWIEEGADRVLTTGAVGADELPPEFPLRRFTSSGVNVGFFANTASGIELRGIPTARGAEVRLASGLTRLLSDWPGTEELVFHRPGPTPDVLLGHAASGAVAVLFPARGQTRLLGVTPDGRGAVILDELPSSGELHFAPRRGPAQSLGTWTVSHLITPVMDPEGCAVVFDSDHGGGGTFLARLP